MLDSERDRLIYGYLAKEVRTLATEFLYSSKSMAECRKVAESGHQFSTRVQGFNFDGIIERFSVLLSIISQWNKCEEPATVGDIVALVRNIVSKYKELHKEHSQPTIRSATSNSKIQVVNINSLKRSLDYTMSSNSTQTEFNDSSLVADVQAESSSTCSVSNSSPNVQDDSSWHRPVKLDDGLTKKSDDNSVNRPGHSLANKPDDSSANTPAKLVRSVLPFYQNFNQNLVYYNICRKGIEGITFCSHYVGRLTYSSLPIDSLFAARLDLTTFQRRIN